MRRSRTIAIGLAAAAIIGLSRWSFLHQSWTLRSVISRDLPGGFIYREAVLARGDLIATLRCVSGKSVDVRLRAVDVRAMDRTPLHVVVDTQRSGVAVNGGYFDQNRRPVGLIRMGGVTASEWSDKPLLSGLIEGGKDRPPRLTSCDEADPKATDVRQCGPSLFGPRDRSGNRTAVAERTAVATSDDRVGFVVTTPITLDDLADVLSLHGTALGLPDIRRAINLDGGPSTGMTFHDTTGIEGTEPRGPISDALAIYPCQTP